MFVLMNTDDIKTSVLSYNNGKKDNLHLLLPSAKKTGSTPALFRKKTLMLNYVLHTRTPGY